MKRVGVKERVVRSRGALGFVQIHVDHRQMPTAKQQPPTASNGWAQAEQRRAEAAGDNELAKIYADKISEMAATGVGCGVWMVFCVHSRP